MKVAMLYECEHKEYNSLTKTSSRNNSIAGRPTFSFLRDSFVGKGSSHYMEIVKNIKGKRKQKLGKQELSK